MTAIVKELLARPDFPQVMDDLREAWEDERRRRDEFIEWLDERHYAEFINGEVVVHSPERLEHGEAEDNLKAIIKPFVRRQALGLFAGNKLVRLPRSDYIPDLAFWPKEVSDDFKSKQAIFPVPALVIEVLSQSTAENDRGVKFREYASAGVKEYWIVDPEERRIEQFENRGGEFHLKNAVIADQRLTSFVIPGLSFSANAAFNALDNDRAAAALLG